MGSADTDATARRRLRQRLESAGVPCEEVARRVEELRASQGRVAVPQGVKVRRNAGLAKSLETQAAIGRAAEQERALDAARSRPAPEVGESPDDRRFRPSSPDSLLHGQGRATGVAARVVKRRSTVTRWQYDQMAGRQVAREPGSPGAAEG